MRVKFFVIACFSFCFCVGCTSFYKGMNTQRSALRGSGDISITSSLDAISTAESAIEVKDKTVEIVEAIRRFLISGQVANLTIPELTTELEKLITEKFGAKYCFLVDLLVAQISGITLDVDKIGTNNVRRIDSFCEGILNGCSKYLVSDRPTTDDSSETKNTKSIKKQEVTQDDIDAFAEYLSRSVAKNKVK